jgi:arylsulfatase A-like enzyme
LAQQRAKAGGRPAAPRDLRPKEAGRRGAGASGERTTRTSPRLRAGRRWIGLALLLGAAGGGAYWSWATWLGGPATPYNILLISLDTVRQDVLGSYGRRPRHAPDLSPSPALDLLASGGVRMVDAYGSSSWTLPSHISMMTGQTPLVHGIETEVGTLDPATPTLPEILKSHGYQTYGFYTAPYVAPHWGFARGFDRYQAIYPPEVAAAAKRSADVRAEVEKVAAAGDWQRYDDLKREEIGINLQLNQRSEEAVTSDQISAAVVSQLQSLAPGGRPWFVFAHLFDPHCDYVPPPPFDTRYDPDYQGTASGKGCLAGDWVANADPNNPGGVIRNISDRDLEHVLALYEGEVAWVDSHVARILRALDDLKLAEQTLVIVVSDHGEEFFDHGNLGHRHALHEEVARVPMILRLPGVLPEGAAVRGPVSVTDLLPTVLEVIGAPAKNRSGGGESFLGLIRGKVDAASRSALSRVVMMFSGNVQVDGTTDIAFRQVMVQDAFHHGRLKILRTRSWPQFPADVDPSLRGALASEAGAQYEREEVQWIDLQRFPEEPADQYSTDFSDASARAALDSFQRQYRELLARRRQSHTSPLPQNVRDALEHLGYGDTTQGAQYPEPDVVLPPPKEERR